MSDTLNYLISKAKILSKSAIRDTTLTSYDSYQKGYEKYVINQGISNLEIITDTSPNHIAAYLIHHFEDKTIKLAMQIILEVVLNHLKGMCMLKIVSTMIQLKKSYI